MLKLQKNSQCLRAKLIPSIAFMLSGFSFDLHAELYFNPALLSGDPQEVADLSRFEKNGSQQPGSYIVDVYLNKAFISSKSINFLVRDEVEETASQSVSKDAQPGIETTENVAMDNTGLTACITTQALEKLNVNTAAFPELAALAADECVPLGTMIPRASTTFDFQKMRLDISIPQVAMKTQARGYIPPEQWDHGINAALFNYSVSGDSSKGKEGESDRYYLNLNSGLNLSGWRLRDYSTWSRYSSDSRSFQQWQHVKTYLQRTIVPLRSELTLGDTSTSGEVFEGFGFQGIQLASDDNMYPDSMRGFAPVVRGIASSNARVSIRQRGYVIYQAYVAQGAFVINDIYPMSSSGDLEVTVTEANGSKQIFTVPYSSVPILQREGHVKYSVTAGKYRSGSDQDDSPTFAQGTLVWGTPHNTTVYGGAQYADNYRAFNLGVGLNLGTWGAVSADVTHADSTLADGSQHQGQSLHFHYARSLNSLGTTFQLTGYHYSTQGFHTLAETARKRMSGWDTENSHEDEPQARPSYADYYNLHNTKRQRLEANVSQRLGRYGSVYLLGSRQTYWNNSSANNSLQAGFSSSIGRVSYSLSYGYRRITGQPRADQTVALTLSLPLDSWFGDRDRLSVHHPVYANINTSRDNNGTTSQQVGISGTWLDDNNLSWNVSQGRTSLGGESGNANLNYQGAYGNSNVGYSHSSHYRQVNYGLSGGIVVHGEGLTLSQPLGDTNVLVAAPGAGNVAVENQTGVHTDSRGYAVLPYAMVYRENRVALDTTTLDDHTDIEGAVNRVVPSRGALVKADFKTRVGLRVLMTLTHNGKPLPFGATVTSGESGSIVGDDGQVYLSGLPLSGKLQAQWGKDAGQQCVVSYHLPKKAIEETLIQIAADCR
ncbi:fimbrial biogenesis usher protein [Rouxiella sp. Mn2063]|uniref:fimbrial biogenesis usher protein n=1 Tax=Rouxiella sp. Mn2063 TaxID=3395262 RepID=UPI003BBDA424